MRRVTPDPSELAATVTDGGEPIVATFQRQSTRYPLRAAVIRSPAPVRTGILHRLVMGLHRLRGDHGFY